jgi:signal transduction histidine kinase
LERANQAKDEFLNIVSHELKTPLNVVMGYTDLLRDGILGETTPAQIDALTTMACRADDLLKVISDILRVVQLNSGNIHTRVSSVNLNDLVEEIRLRCKISSDEGRAVIWSIPPALPTVETDPEMLMEIFQNLLHNAAKFTEKGWIKIALRHLPKRNLVRLTVADTGVGISKEVAPVIFDKFRQGDSSATRFHGGVGLGLYIVKVLAQLLNYKIKLKSQIGRGSVFQVAIPC